MPVVPMQQILKDAFQRYGVGAFNIVDWVTMDAVLSAAAETKSPVIVQVSVKTVKVMGAKLIQVMFAEMAGRVPVPATLHLDHCPDRKVIEECVAAGWNSVLFDASKLSYEDNLEQTRAVVELAHRHGVAVEGELEAVKGVEDGMGGEDGGAVVALDKAVAFIRETGIDSFAPAIGTAHGMYKGAPKINFQRVSEIVTAEPIPLVVHGGTGLSDETFQELIRRGAPKINISTQLKITLADSYRTYLEAKPNEYDPLKLLGAVKKNLVERVTCFMRVFGSEGEGGMSSKALIFDCDGVLGDTEQFGHLPAFNRMWREMGVPWAWSVEEYGRKLKIGGGKERMSSLFQEPVFLAAWPACPADDNTRQELVGQWHKRKSAIYKEIIQSGKIPPRSGVRRLSEEALAAGWTLAVASTSARESVEAVLRHAMGEETAARFSLVLAGDVVKAKKPAPDIYLMAARELGIGPADCVAVEDSGNGLEAAAAAGMPCIVTVSGYTREEDFSKAAIVLTCLGDPQGERCEVLANRSGVRVRDWFTVADLERIRAGAAANSA